MKKFNKTESLLLEYIMERAHTRNCEYMINPCDCGYRSLLESLDPLALADVLYKLEAKKSKK